MKKDKTLKQLIEEQGKRLESLEDFMHIQVKINKHLFGLEEESVEDDKYKRWEREGYRSKLANIIIAPEDLCVMKDGEEKKHFTFDGAIEYTKKLPNGWRLPTQKELLLICVEFGIDEDGLLTGDELIKSLGFVRSGSVNSGSLYNAGYSANYWSSTVESSSNARSLYFVSTFVYPANNSNRSNGFSVRCVKDMEEEKE